MAATSDDEIELRVIEKSGSDVEDDGATDPCLTSDEHNVRYQRQQSNVVSARQRWGQVRRFVDDQTEARKVTTDKWVNLTRSVSHGVADFFGVSEDDQSKREKSMEKWKARSRRLHNKSMLLGGRKKGELTEPYLGDTSLADSGETPRITSFLTSGEESDHFDGSATASRWITKTAQPIDPFARMHSRQFSKISAASSRRTVRQQPSRRNHRDSVLKMAIDGVKFLALGTTGTEAKTPSVVRSRSFAPNTRQMPASCGTDEVLDDVFFDAAVPTSPAVHQRLKLTSSGQSYQADVDRNHDKTPASLNSYDTPDGTKIFVTHPNPFEFEKQRPAAEDRRIAGGVGMRRVADKLIDATQVNTDRRHFGIGIVGDLIGTDYRKSRMDTHVEKQMSEMDDYRPYFSYWVTFVHIVIHIFAISTYGISTIGFSVTRKHGEVRKTNLAVEKVHYDEQDNMWIGPRQADLIHLGAKYSPCMRWDANVMKTLDDDKVKESQSGCCIMNDGSGCVQMSTKICPKTLATWKNGSVCGQDPTACKSSELPRDLWSKKDFTDWPICKEKEPTPDDKKEEFNHMTCELVGRPCCIGIHGQCLITHPEHCTFLRGYFHSEATLCSQVSCLSEICGMLPFFNPKTPDQFYRLWTSLFLHAGLVQLAITVVLQVFVMRDMEKLLGWFRIAVIYIGSGIAGSLASAIFLPYYVEAGPSGSQFGLVACLFVEVIHSWQIIDSPWWAIGKLSLILLTLFAVGLLPWVDNYAHLIGFLFGFLLSFAFLPYITFNLVSRKGRIIAIVVCLLAAVGLFTILIVLFYVSPIYNCKYCHLFNCIPFTETFCRSMEFKIDPITDL